MGVDYHAIMRNNFSYYTNFLKGRHRLIGGEANQHSK